MSINLQDAFSSLNRLKKDTSDIPQDTFAEWCDFINKFIYRGLLGVEPERFINEYTFNASAGVTSYALPTDFRSMSHVGTGIFYVDSSGLATTSKLPKTGYGSLVAGYYLKGSNIILTPPSWNQAQTFCLRYAPKQTKLTSLSQYFTLDGTVSGAEIIPDEYLDELVKALDVRYTEWDEEVGAETYADGRFARALEELLRTIRRDPAVFSVFDSSVNC